MDAASTRPPAKTDGLTFEKDLEKELRPLLRPLGYGAYEMGTGGAADIANGKRSAWDMRRLTPPQPLTRPEVLGLDAGDFFSMGIGH